MATSDHRLVTQKGNHKAVKSHSQCFGLQYSYAVCVCVCEGGCYKSSLTCVCAHRRWGREVGRGIGWGVKFTRKRGKGRRRRR